MARILLIARDRAKQSVVCETMREQSTHEVVFAFGRDEALEEIGRSRFDLVLVEADLPASDVADIYRHIQVVPDGARPAVMLLSQSDKQREGRQLSLDCTGAELMLDISSAELLERIAATLRPKFLEDEGTVPGGRGALERGDGKFVEQARQGQELSGNLRLERDALRETFDVFQDGLLLLDADGRVILENAAGRQLLAIPPGRTRSAPGSEGSDAAGAGSFQESLAELAREVIRKNAMCNRTLTWNGRQLGVRVDPAAGRRALVCVRDVTEERDSELRRLQSEKLASIGMLAAGVAHEINNPASFVLANVDSLAGILRKIDEAMRAEGVYAHNGGLANLLFDAMTVVQESKEGMARIHRIARDLHSFSRVDDDANSLSDVNAAVDSALTLLRSELRYRATVERSLRASQMVRASSARLGQVFLNLILNAAHALSDLHPRRNRLYVRSRDDGAYVVVDIEDNGPGIPAEMMPRIFESFFTTKPPGVGTGLGLPISLDIVRRAGGELTAESEAGRGAVFRVRLPAAVGVPATRTRSISSLKAIQRRRILAIDDEALLLKAFQRMLVPHHDIETKLGGREALRTFGQDRTFDVVLCDLQMPDMSGVELHTAVKQQWPELAERFIFITGGAFSPEARRFLENPNIACINKPFQLRELLELIETRVSACQPEN